MSKKNIFWMGDRLIIALVIILMLSPMAILVVKGILAQEPSSRNDLFGILVNERSIVLLTNSILLGIWVSLGTSVIAFVAASWLWMQRPRLGVSLAWAVIPIAAMPPYLHSLAWISVFNAAGKVLDGLGIWLPSPTGWLMTFWVECTAFFPIAFGCAWIGLLAIDSELIEAGRLVRPDLACLFRIVLPLCLPAVAVGAGVIFLYSILDYSIPALHQIHVYSMEVFAEFSASGDPFRAFVTAIPLTLVAVLPLSGLILPARKLAGTNLYRPRQWKSPTCLPSGIQQMGQTTLLAAAIMEVVPFIVMLGMSTAAPWPPGLISNSSDEIRTSLQVAVASGALSTTIAFVAALALKGRYQVGWFTWFLMVLPLAFPPSLVGVSLIPWRSFLPACELFLPVLAHCLRFLPIGILVVYTQLNLLDPLLFDAAAVMQKKHWRRILLIHIPLAIPATLGAFALIIALSMGEFSSILLVIPPGRSTLVFQIYNYLHFGASQTVALLTLLQTVSILLAGSVAMGIYLLSRSSFNYEVEAV